MDTLEKPKYDHDFVLWLEFQAKLLRQGRVGELDLENLAEEVESIGRSDRREVQNRLTVLLAHLLKYQFQAKRRSRSWRVTIDEQRRQLELVFNDSPSLLKSYALTIFDDTYQYARRRVSVETRLNSEAFPETCPYTLAQVLDEDFFPEG
ncbi:MAG: Phage protein [uncultured Truepera sp.]|uniref:Phage protein n=1 Tax=uncultured Truepera sp. TaxID=543023 RepID=A0A6J4VM02_9DEIN|nr:MAG: Phage protein [uncultured Truepera sp.]